MMLNDRVHRWIHTPARFELTVARSLAAVVMLPHGWMKIGVFAEMVGILGSEYGLPAPLAVGVILVEFLAPIALLVGLGGRVAALCMAVVMFGAGLYHLENGLMMNWFGEKTGEGFAFHLLFLATLLPLIVHGSGPWSFDRALSLRLRSKDPLSARGSDRA